MMTDTAHVAALYFPTATCYNRHSDNINEEANAYHAIAERIYMLVVDTKKRRVTLNGTDVHIGYLFGHDDIPVAFDDGELPAVMDELGIPYKFRDVEKEGMWSRPATVTTLVLHPDTDDELVIEPIMVTSSYTYGSHPAYPIDAEKLAGAQWSVVCGEDTMDVFGYAEAAASDLKEHIEAIVGQYASGLDGADINLKNAFYDTLSYVLKRDDSIDVIHDFVKRRQNSLYDDHIYCAGCLSLRPRDEFHEESRKETEWEQTYTDAGYGDDDTFGEVTRLNTYRICDHCGKEVKIDSMWMSTRNEKSRWELRAER